MKDGQKRLCIHQRDRRVEDSNAGPPGCESMLKPLSNAAFHSIYVFLMKKEKWKEISCKPTFETFCILFLFNKDVKMTRFHFAMP